MLKEYSILLASVLLSGIISAFVLAFIFSPTASRIIKRPFSYKQSFIYLLLQDVLGHWVMLIIYLLMGSYRPAVTEIPQTWVENLVSIFLIGLFLNNLWPKNKLKLPKSKNILFSAWGVALILAKDAAMLACLYWYLSRP